MQVAVISDIHGNLPALEAVIAHVDAWSPDVVVVGGDIINRGPRSGDCLDLLIGRSGTQGWHLLRGNHEEFVLDCGTPDQSLSGPAYQVKQFAHFALSQVSPHLETLRTLPDVFEKPAPDGALLRIVHASMRSNRDGIYPMSIDADIRRQIAPAPAVFITGHTHRPLIRWVDNTLVVNIGSVGASFDGDRRAGYGRFTWQSDHWAAEIIRVEYDFQRIEDDYVQSGFLENGGPLAQLMLVELRKACGLIHRWASQYEAAVLSNRMTLEESVRLVLGEGDIQPFTGPPGWVI
ncbi:MAG: metallophosphoesterase family protein [Anaerolineales bacterium]|uniref:metallophosphoesterase family protein n=1 Tax=Promineifilum sp. TaxID=2664178 RepID=UPI001D645502|nr:metallophosphoesterase family protein [Anaerolineales bacterium]MCB8936201.1 metallophosphoesterase family protein [Promineifilum sp.]MCO5178661.1 metallophosphatase family protein [Promineifilum sp.]